MFLRVSRRHPTEAAAVGRMLAGYTDLEFGLLEAINAAHDDFDAHLKAMFRTRGESQRLAIADALGRKRFVALRLGTEFAMTMGAIQRCLRIRNQYAHCHWHVSSQIMGFVNLEELAKGNEPLDGESAFVYCKTTPDLVKQQEAFFDHTDYLLMWLQEEARVRHGKQSLNPHPKPKPETHPALYFA